MEYIKFTEYLVGSIIDDKESFEVSLLSETDNEVVINVSVSANDIGKVIGKQGKTANSIRNLVQASFFSNYKKVKIDFHNYE